MRELASSMRARMSDDTAGTLRRLAMPRRPRSRGLADRLRRSAGRRRSLLGTMVMVGEFRERALANSERELENTVLLLTRHFDQQFEDYRGPGARRDRRG